jgi:Ulp1 family protease
MVDIFSKDFLIFPIIKESHWFLAIVCNANTVSVINDKTELKKPLEESEANEVEKRYIFKYLIIT